MELLNWLVAGLDPCVAGSAKDDVQILAIGFCPFTGCHWIVEDRSASSIPARSDGGPEALRPA